MDLEQKKRALQQSIANLKQKVEEQEDEELRQLMEEERLLKVKLQTGEGGSAGNASAAFKNVQQKVNAENESGKAQAELQNLTGLKFDMTGILGTSLVLAPVS